MPRLSEPELGAVFAALADPTRRQVVRSLAREQAVTASGLAGELPMTRQAVAKHLAALERAGLVTPRREGRETRYRLTPGAARRGDRVDGRRRRALGPLARAPQRAGAASLTTRPPTSRASSAGSIGKTACGVPAAAHTTS